MFLLDLPCIAAVKYAHVLTSQILVSFQDAAESWGAVGSRLILFILTHLQQADPTLALFS